LDSRKDQAIDLYVDPVQDDVTGRSGEADGAYATDRWQIELDHESLRNAAKVGARVDLAVERGALRAARRAETHGDHGCGPLERPALTLPSLHARTVAGLLRLDDRTEQRAGLAIAGDDDAITARSTPDQLRRAILQITNPDVDDSHDHGHNCHSHACGA